MRAQDVLNEIQGHLQRSRERVVLYVEGMTDVNVFAALCGHEEPRGILIVALGGNRKVARYVELASAAGDSYRGVYGVLDGDGASLSETAPRFDAQYSGPLFQWKRYSIENYLFEPSYWPGQWGALPDFQQIAHRDYAPYTALNVLVDDLQARFDDIGLGAHVFPTEPLTSGRQFEQLLWQGQVLVNDLDVRAEYATRLNIIRERITQSPAEMHALINGKFFTEHFAVQRAGSKEKAWEDWLAAAQNQRRPNDVQNLINRIADRHNLS